MTAIVVHRQKDTFRQVGRISRKMIYLLSFGIFDGESDIIDVTFSRAPAKRNVAQRHRDRKRLRRRGCGDFFNDLPGIVIQGNGPSLPSRGRRTCHNDPIAARAKTHCVTRGRFSMIAITNGINTIVEQSEKRHLISELHRCTRGHMIRSINHFSITFDNNLINNRQRAVTHCFNRINPAY